MARYNRDWETGFILEENHLRRIEKILKNRDGNCTMCYRAFTEVDEVERVIVKSKVDELLEAPLEGHEIMRIEIECTPEETSQPIVELVFSRDGHNLQVKEGSEDSVDAVSKEIRKFLHDHVHKVRFSWHKNIKTLMFLVSLFAGIAVFIWFDLKHEAVHLDRAAVLRSDDVKEKLNYLVNAVNLSSNRVARFFLALTPFFIFTLLMRIGFCERAMAIACEHVAPEYVFLFGAEVERQRKREWKRSFVLVAIVVASLVNLATGLIVQLVFAN